MKTNHASGMIILIFLYALVFLPGISFGKWVIGKDGKLDRMEKTSNQSSSPNANDKLREQRAVIRTRQQILMLDDLYKTAVVLITEHYVNTSATLSAATASKALFAAMKEKGWHDARLLGFTDTLLNSAENAPQDDFEKAAKQALLTGASTHEEVITHNNKQYLRMATAVPVVMEKCVMCHANFAENKEVIGAISYTVPLID